MMEKTCQHRTDISSGCPNKVEFLAGGPREVGQKSSGGGELGKLGILGEKKKRNRGEGRGI
jgi:hypothetical protein